MEEYYVTGRAENWIKRVGELWVITSSEQKVGHASFLMLQELREIRRVNCGPGDKCVRNII